MKGSQREKTVRDHAARWLCEALKRRPGVAAGRHWVECRVAPSSTQGRGQADAVIAARLRDESHYTVVVEAKSIRTGSDFDELHADCAAAGVGLIGVSRRKEIMVHLHARQDRCLGPKLPEYARGAALLLELSGSGAGPLDAGEPRGFER